MRTIELFSGAGGLSLGLKRAGFEIIQAYDSSNRAVEVYRRNVGSHVWQADLKNIFEIGPKLSALAPQAVVGGPPCQDFSAAGDRIEGERAAMTLVFAMLVCIAKPEWFIMENVPRASKSKAWAEARIMLVRAGYGITQTTLNASYYGVPQARKRLIVIGRLGERDGFLDSSLAAARSQEPMTIRHMLRNDLPDDVMLSSADAFYTRPFYSGRGVRTLDEPAPSVIRTTRERPRPHYLCSPHPGDPIPAAQAAILTQAQVSRIQGFPSDWEWGNTPCREIDQMIANAFPAPLAEAIGNVILTRAAGRSIPQIEGHFGQWLWKRYGMSKASIRNIKTRLNRGRRLLKGRTFSEEAAEGAALESCEHFRQLPKGTRSDIRTALKIYRVLQIESLLPEEPTDRASAVLEAVAA